MIARFVAIALAVTLVIVGGSFLASTESGKRLLRSPAERAAYENGIESGTIAGGAYYIKDYLNKHPDVPRARDWEELSRCEGKISCPEDPKLIPHWCDGFTVGWEVARKRAVNAYFEYTIAEQSQLTDHGIQSHGFCIAVYPHENLYHGNGLLRKAALNVEVARKEGKLRKWVPPGIPHAAGFQE